MLGQAFDTYCVLHWVVEMRMLRCTRFVCAGSAIIVTDLTVLDEYVDSLMSSLIKIQPLKTISTK